MYIKFKNWFKLYSILKKILYQWILSICILKKLISLSKFIKYINKLNKVKYY